MTKILLGVESVVVATMMWGSLNMLELCAIAYGAHVTYIPYFNYPIKVLVEALS